MSLRGQRVRLVPVATSHAEDLFAAGHDGGDPALWQYLPYGPFADAEEMRLWLSACAESEDPRFYAIVEQATSGDPTQALQSLPPALRDPVAHALRVAFVAGFDRILWIAATIGFAGAVLAFLLVRQRDFATRDEPAMTARQLGALSETP